MILLFLGLFVVFIPLALRFHHNTTSLAVVEKEMSLCWDGTRIVIHAGEKGCYNGFKQKVPVEIRPLFFLPIPLNHADEELLTTVPGIGPVTAQLIVQRRNKHGKITNRGELLEIRGIGEKVAENIERHTTYDL